MTPRCKHLAPASLAGGFSVLVSVFALSALFLYPQLLSQPDRLEFFQEWFHQIDGVGGLLGFHGPFVAAAIAGYYVGTRADATAEYRSILLAFACVGVATYWTIGLLGWFATTPEFRGELPWTLFQAEYLVGIAWFTLAGVVGATLGELRTRSVPATA